MAEACLRCYGLLCSGHPAKSSAVGGRGVIGRVYEIESFAHLNVPMWRFPYCWVHRLELGGGLLNNLFTHHLAQVLYVTQGTVHAVAGEARALRDQASVGPTIHDFRQLFALTGTRDPEQATNGALRMRICPIPSSLKFGWATAIWPMRSFVHRSLGSTPAGIPGLSRRGGFALHARCMG